MPSSSLHLVLVLTWLQQVTVRTGLPWAFYCPFASSERMYLDTQQPSFVHSAPQSSHDTLSLINRLACLSSCQVRNPAML
ncbi:hypothetical protein BJY04DRAFT_73191 [Aspergillus karnatakaensis]|uniref:uncharacterized protein n=1 Tax=Aspergillus karnatakaensis TaxID=1810916 RepID=UPI003CCD47D4